MSKSKKSEGFKISETMIKTIHQFITEYCLLSENTLHDIRNINQHQQLHGDQIARFPFYLSKEQELTLTGTIIWVRDKKSTILPYINPQLLKFYDASCIITRCKQGATIFSLLEEHLKSNEGYDYSEEKERLEQQSDFIVQSTESIYEEKQRQKTKRQRKKSYR